MTLAMPRALLAPDRMTPDRRIWLGRLPEIVAEARVKWSLEIGQPFDGPDVSVAWVAPVVRKNGAAAVLKVGMPHMESDQEAEGLRFWSGNPTVELLAEDGATGALLLERCQPGTSLRNLPEKDQDVVVGRLLRRLWRQPNVPRRFRPLSAMLEYWAEATRGCASQWCDVGLVEAGLDLFGTLSKPSPEDVLLATDLHAGNVLAAGREPWLVIDPKPFVGDPAYDATQHLLNCRSRLIADPEGMVERISGLLELDPVRVRLWLFARAASEPRDVWDEDSLCLARALSG